MKHQSIRAEQASGTTDVALRAGRSRWGRVASATTITLVIAASGVALAAWNVTGSGQGSVGADTAVALVVEDFQLDDLLYPGLTTSGTLTVSNPNPFPVRITDVEFGTIVITTAGPGCTVVASAVTFTDKTGVSLFLAADTADIELTLNTVATMGAASDDDCQGATFTAPIELTAESTTAP
jgi:hypothetical protein